MTWGDEKVRKWKMRLVTTCAGCAILLIFGSYISRSIIATKSAQISLERKAMADIIEHSGSGLVTTDNRGVITSWSNKLEEMTGFTASERVGTPIAAAMAEPFASRHTNGMATYRDGPHPDFNRQLPCRFLTKDGDSIRVLAAVWVSYELNYAIAIIVPQLEIDDPLDPEIPEQSPLPTPPKGRP